MEVERLNHETKFSHKDIAPEKCRPIMPPRKQISEYIEHAV